MADETKWNRMVVAISLNHLVPVNPVASKTAPTNLSTGVIHFLSLPLSLFLFQPTIFGFTYPISILAVVDTIARIEVLIKIMTEAPISFPRKRLLDKDS